MCGLTRHSCTALASVALGALALAACGEEPSSTTSTTTHSTATTTRAPGDGPSEGEPAQSVPRAQCPQELENCATASGTIIYVERRDPDGDGDAHFVLSSEEGITFPGISVIDVAAALRPQPLPGPGAEISAAGPVYRGSYGQRQIEAVELNVEEG